MKTATDAKPGREYNNDRRKHTTFSIPTIPQTTNRAKRGPLWRRGHRGPANCELQSRRSDPRRDTATGGGGTSQDNTTWHARTAASVHHPSPKRQIKLLGPLASGHGRLWDPLAMHVVVSWLHPCYFSMFNPFGWFAPVAWFYGSA